MIPIQKLENARLPLDEFAEYLHLSTQKTGAYRQNTALEMSLRAAILHLESALDAVLFRLEFAVLPASSTMQIAPIADWSNPTILRAYSRSNPSEDFASDWILRQNHNWCAHYQGQAAILDWQIDIALGFGEWADIPADIQTAIFQFARYHYEERGGARLAAPFVSQSLLQKYRPFKIGFSHVK